MLFSTVVKLHSDLRVLTQLQLQELTLFSQEEEEEEPTCSFCKTKSLKFGGFPVVVGRVSGGCLEGVWMESVWRLEGNYGMSKWCLGCLELSEGQVRTDQVSAGKVRTGQVRTGKVRIGQVSTG